MRVLAEYTIAGKKPMTVGVQGETLDDIKAQVLDDINGMTQHVITVRLYMSEHPEVILSETIRILTEYGGVTRAQWADFTPNPEYLQAKKMAPMTAEMVVQMVLGSDEVLEALTDVIADKLKERGLI